MSELGPNFQHLSHKNCPLDAVLKVLREEAVQNLLPSPPKAITVMPGRRITKSAAYFFAGTGGATSIKGELIACVPKLNDAAGYREARRLVKQDLSLTPQALNPKA